MESSRTAVAVERPRSAEGAFVWQIAMLAGADMAFGQVFASKPGRIGGVLLDFTDREGQ